MTKIDKEVSRRKQERIEAERMARAELAQAVSQYNLNNFKIIEKTQAFYSNIRKTYEDYADDLRSENPKMLLDFDDYVQVLLKEVKNITDNVLVEIQNVLILAHNEGAYVVNGEQDKIDYGKLLDSVRDSQALLKTSSGVISDSITAMGVFKDEFKKDEVDGEVGIIVATRIAVIGEDLLASISDSNKSDIVVALEWLKALSEDE